MINKYKSEGEIKYQEQRMTILKSTFCKKYKEIWQI
jgi:hypothetical protein